MPTINQLSGISQVSGGDLLPVYVSNNGDARKVSITQLLNYFQTVFASPTVSTNLYTPGTGFNITVPTPVSEQQWMIIQPASALASGTVTLPLNTGVPDGTQVLITTTQLIQSFTLALNGAAAGFGFPSSLDAGAGITVRFYQATNSWYNISAEFSATVLPSLTVTPGLTTLQGMVVGRGSGVNTSNVVMGDGLTANTTGTNNVAIGNLALGANTTGLKNIAIGTNALKVNDSGFSNVAIGFDSQQARTSARHNIAIGDSTLRLNVSGLYNTAIGGLALSSTTGNTNIGIGYLSGFEITTGSNNVILGNFDGYIAGVLDIRTATTGYVVLSNGTGDVAAYWDGVNGTFLGTLTTTDAITTTSLTTSTFTALSGGTNTIASATSITPVKSINFISGTAAIETIVTQPPITGANGTIILIPTGAFTWTTAGNIAIAGTAVVGKALHMTFSGSSLKWYPSYV
jgi:hypothetical protein